MKENSTAHGRSMVFFAMFAGYTVSYFLRRTLASSMGLLREELKLDTNNLGILASLFALAYGVSKFIGGVTSDKYSPRNLFALSLLGASASNLMFAMGSSLYMLAFAWGMNGFFQGFCWPALAAILKAWFKPEEVGFWWSVLSSSGNFGSAISPIIVSSIVNYSGSWRAPFLSLALFALVALAVLFGMIKDSPPMETTHEMDAAEYLKKREQVMPNSPSHSYRSIKQNGHDQRVPLTPGLTPRKPARKNLRIALVDTEEQQEDDKGTPSSAAGRVVAAPPAPGSWSLLLWSPLFWAATVCHMLAYGVKTAVGDWGFLFVTAYKNADNITAGSAMSAFEIGGVVGSLACGAISDRLVVYFRSWQMNDGISRIPVCVACAVFSALSLGVLHRESSPLMDKTALFVAGFCLYGASCLFGVIQADVAPKGLSGRSNAMGGMLSQACGFMAGYPFSIVVETMGWGTGFSVLEMTDRKSVV